jgi:hypothetical protein
VVRFTTETTLQTQTSANRKEQDMTDQITIKQPKTKSPHLSLSCISHTEYGEPVKFLEVEAEVPRKTYRRRRRDGENSGRHVKPTAAISSPLPLITRLSAGV